MEISRLQEELIKKDSHIQTLTNDFNSKEMELNVKMNEFNTKIEDKNLTLQILLDKYEKMEKELGETVK